MTNGHVPVARSNDLPTIYQKGASNEENPSHSDSDAEEEHDHETSEAVPVCYCIFCCIYICVCVCVRACVCVCVSFAPARCQCLTWYFVCCLVADKDIHYNLPKCSLKGQEKKLNLSLARYAAGRT